MPRRKATLIYNPIAGPADRLAMMREVAILWRKHGWEVVLQPTQWAGHAELLARQAAVDGVELVLAAGGDGTFSQVAHGLAGTETIFAPLPAGTGNSMAKELLMPRPTHVRSGQLLDSAETLLHGHIHTIDLLQCGDGRHALLWAGAGVSAYVVDQIEPRTKTQKRFGAVGYFLQASTHILRFPRFESVIEVDGKRHEGVYNVINVSNCRRFVGGEVTLHPTAQWDDGVLEVALLEGRSAFNLYRAMWQARFGRIDLNRNATLLTGKYVSIATDRPMPYHIDGESAGQTPLTCRIRPQALRTLIPNTAPSDLFQQSGERFN